MSVGNTWTLKDFNALFAMKIYMVQVMEEVATTFLIQLDKIGFIWFKWLDYRISQQQTVVWLS